MKNGEKLQVRNWIVEKIEMDGTDYMEVRTIGGEFRVMYRMDHIIYSMLDSLEEENKDSLAVIFGNIMAVAAIARELACFVWGMMTDNIEMKAA